MRVNFLTFRSSLSEGGIQNTSYLLAKFFSKLPDLDFVLFTDEKSDVPTNCNTVLLRFNGEWDFAFFWDIFKYLKNNRCPDINVAAHWLCGFSSFLYKLVYRKPYVVMVYGNEIINNNTTIKERIKHQIRKSVLNHASAIFACSHYSKELCKRVSNNERIIVIHPPIEYKKYDACVSENRYTLFSIGRHIERKGFQYVIDSMKLLLTKYPEMKYRIAGTGPFQSELIKKTEENGLKDCVAFLGRISEEAKQEELDQCDVFIMTSNENLMENEVEGFGICYIEASMHGKWVIAADKGGVRDAVIDGVTGRLIKEINASNIFSAVDEYFSRIVDNFDSKTIKEWASAHDIEMIGKKYFSILCDIVKKGND